MTKDDLDHIPSIVPTRDGGPTGGARKKRPAVGGSGGGRRSGGKAPAPRTSAGAGVWAWLFILISLGGAAAAAGWAWKLQEKLVQADRLMEGYAQRIVDLEDRLADTDEGMSQNATLQAAKVRELDSEVRKLWDNVWKQAGARLDKLEASSKSHGSKIGAAETSLAQVEAQLKAASGDIAKLKSVASDLERLMTSANANQEEVERVADALNSVNLEFAKLNKRVQSNEEWLGSIDAFRRQVNSSIADVKATIRTYHTPPQ